MVTVLFIKEFPPSPRFNLVTSAAILHQQLTPKFPLFRSLLLSDLPSRDMSAIAAQRYRVGYALEPKKINNFFQMSLIDYAKQRGIDLIQIEPTKSLTEQGPFDCVIHKLHSEHWKNQLYEFSTKYPNGVIIDHPVLVEQLQNRISMLEVVTQLQISLENATIRVPNQVLVSDANAMEEQSLNLKFPVIAKPLFVDGTATSHKLCLVFDCEGLRTLQIPIVLQEFVNHGGVVFKVYVAGNHVKCVKRKSLPDISEEMAKKPRGRTLPFSQISNLTVQENSHNETIEKAEMPRRNLVMELARALREALGLNLFNVDVIRDANDCKRYLVIDINYFPGYAKLPSYEPFITDFLLDVVSNKIA